MGSEPLGMGGRIQEGYLMKIIWDFLGVHIELYDGFAWCFVGLLASIELWLCVGVYKLLEIWGIVK